MDEKRSSIKKKIKKTHFLLPFMCKCAAICAFDSDRVPDSSLYWRASRRGSVYPKARSRDGDKDYWLTRICYFFFSSIQIKTVSGTTYRAQSHVCHINLIDLLLSDHWLRVTSHSGTGDHLLFLLFSIRYHVPCTALACATLNVCWYCIVFANNIII